MRIDRDHPHAGEVAKIIVNGEEWDMIKFPVLSLDTNEGWLEYTCDSEGMQLPSGSYAFTKTKIPCFVLGDAEIHVHLKDGTIIEGTHKKSISPTLATPEEWKVVVQALTQSSLDPNTVMRMILRHYKDLLLPLEPREVKEPRVLRTLEI